MQVLEIQKGVTVQRAHLQLHAAVLLFGATAVLGKAIGTSGFGIVWLRVAIAGLSLALLPGCIRQIRAMDNRLRRDVIIGGVLITGHWVAFYESIKAANASVAVTCIALAALFTALLDPLWRRRKTSAMELGLAMIALLGVIVMFRTAPTGHGIGIALGVAAAALVAIYGILAKSYLSRAGLIGVSCLQFTAGTLLLSALVPVYLAMRPNETVIPSQVSDWGWLFMLALGCTTVPFLLNLSALRVLSPFTISLTFNLEPVYGVTLAIIIYQEHQEMSRGFVIGAGAIILAVVLHTWRSIKARRQSTMC